MLAFGYAQILFGEFEFNHMSPLLIVNFFLEGGGGYGTAQKGPGAAYKQFDPS